ncbi:MAG TPA: tetratricopeptide repeat protein [Terriglobales bacterium]|jgi:tetratricopeptide (TPR) repeat protein
MISIRRTAFWLCLAAVSPAQTTPPSNSTQNPASDQPASARTEFVSAQKLLQQGKYDDAIQQLQELHAREPGLKMLSHELGAAYYTKGDYPKAAESLQQALKEDPSDNEATQLLGLSYYLSGRPAEAIPYLEKVQSWYPRANVDASYILAMCYMQSHDYEHARKAFATMYEVAPDSAAAYLFTAQQLFRHEFETIAEDYAQKAAALDPRLPQAHFLLGELYLFKSRVPEALAEFQKELAINPASAATYYKIGDAYSRLQKFDDAERVLQRSIWLDSTSTGPFILMGKVLAKKGESELAVRALRHALSMDPNNPVPHHLLGQTYRDLGKTEDAERELKLAEQLQVRGGPDSESAQQK